MPKKLTQSEFIERSNQVHNNKYDYSKVEYVNITTKTTIRCQKHGEFRQMPNTHLSGGGCPDCGRNNIIIAQRSNTEDFIEKAKIKHKDEYDYSLVKYINSKIKVIIICIEHGEFLQTPNNHLKGNKCPRCNGHPLLTQYEFIEKAIKKHGNKYDYSLANYTQNDIKITIVCQNHGEFRQTPHDHLGGHGCIKCGWQLTTLFEEFIKKAQEVHNDKYNYSKFIYINYRTKGIIICPEHGEFELKPCNHICGAGCSICESQINTNQFIEKAQIVHNDLYDYSLVKYINSKDKVVIICPKHGKFQQIPNGHLSGQKCPKCSMKNRFTGYSIADLSLKEKIGVLYYLKITHKNNHIFYKLGISSDFDRRLQDIKNLGKNDIKKIEPLYLYNSFQDNTLLTIFEALIKEQAILQAFHKYRIYDFSYSTELFIKDISQLPGWTELIYSVVEL